MREEKLPIETRRWVIPLGLALGLHGLLFSILSHVPQTPMAVPEAPVSVQLVVLQRPVAPEIEAPDAEPPGAETPDIEIREPEPIPPPVERTKPLAPPPEPLPVTPDEPLPEATTPQPDRPDFQTLPEPTPTPPPAPSTSQPLTILSTEDPVNGEAIPDRWRLPSGASIPLDRTQQPGNSDLESLALSLNCLGFDADCAEQRKTIFFEDQLSGTDLVWMPSFAHSGLSDGDLFGLSEAEIRKRLGIKVAGENGFAILPGVVIDGPWWDALHGVNKACKYSIGSAGPDDGFSQGKKLIKTCDPGRSSSKDRIGFIPKPAE